MRNRRTTIIVLVILAAFVIGLAIGQQAVLLARVFVPPPPSYIPPDQTITPNINTDTNVQAIRQELTRFLWASEVLPDVRPGSPTPDTSGTWADLRNVASIDQMVIQQDYGIDSVVLWFEPVNPSGIFVVYHQGHEGGVTRGREAIAGLLDNGATVAALAMPLVGDNPQPTVEVPPFGHVRLERHDQFALLEAQDRPQHPIRLLITPVIAVVNEAAAQGYTDIRMIGISGGGWTTTLAAALDTRIVRSVPVAGSVPLTLADPIEDWGDYEQHHMGLYNIATYADLYVLGGWEPGRSQVQILHTEDPCCFRGDSRIEAYAPGIEQVTAGRSSVIVVESNQHRVGPEAVAKVLE